MKLGEALSLRARQAQKLTDLLGRIKQSAVVQEGDEPSEDISTLIEQYLLTSQSQSELVWQITATNVNVGLLTKLQERERLVRERSLYAAVAAAATPGRDLFRYSRTEIKYVPQVDVADFRLREETVAEKVRVLDAEIQALNWETELLV